MIAALGIAGKLAKSKPFIAGVSALAICFVLYLGYRHYDGLLNQVETLQTETALLRNGLDIERQAVVELSEVITDWEGSRQELLRKIEEMQDEAHHAREETRRLHELFSTLDFEDMAPAVLDSLADDTTDRLWRLLQSASDPSGHGDGGAPGPSPSPTGSDPDRDDERGLDSDRDSGGADAGPGPEAVRDPVEQPGRDPAMGP